MPDQSIPALPPDLHAASDHERLAQDRIPPDVLAYIEGGSGQEVTLRRNRAAFSHHAILPRLLRSVGHGHTRSLLLGHEFDHPILLAPVAWQQLVHPHGEIDTARGASAMDTCMVLSPLSSCSLEDVAQHANKRWFQLYWQASREHTLSLVRRAESAGYSALVLTLDASVPTPSLRAQRAGFRFPAGVRAVNLQELPPIELPPVGAGESAIFQGVMSTAPGWEDLRWLRQQTTLPLLVKGSVVCWRSQRRSSQPGAVDITPWKMALSPAPTGGSSIGGSSCRLTARTPAGKRKPARWARSEGVWTLASSVSTRAE